MKNLAGQRFGRLVVISSTDLRHHECIVWICLCDCGKMTRVDTGHLMSGGISGCGCKRGNRTHGHKVGRKASKTYQSWQMMGMRCNNPKRHDYKYYGGRGITICKKWNNFIGFLNDMGERPPGTTLDRINNDGNYEPLNCRWADWKTQSNNRRHTLGK